MASITIRNLEEKLKSQLRIRAAHHGRSMEDEAREILRLTLAKGNQAAPNLVEKIRRRFAALRGIDLELATREALREPPRFKK